MERAEKQKSADMQTQPRKEFFKKKETTK